jgi:hypothetical protein
LQNRSPQGQALCDQQKEPSLQAKTRIISNKQWAIRSFCQLHIASCRLPLKENKTEIELWLVLPALTYQKTKEAK